MNSGSCILKRRYGNIGGCILQEVKMTGLDGYERGLL